MSAAAIPNRSMHGDKTVAGALALAMHALFLVLLVFGVSWQKKAETPVMADLWSNLPPLQKPEVAPPPDPEPAPPKPAPKVVAPPPPKVEPKPAVKPDIALKKKAEEKKKEPPKVEPKKDDRAEKARVAKEAEAKRLREEQAKRDLELIRKEREDDAAAAAKAKAAAAAKAAVAREIDKYIIGIRAKVHAQVRLPDNLQGNPEALVAVSLQPGGYLEDVRLVRSSGNPDYDRAVLSAIDSAQPFNVPTGELFHQYFRRFNMPFRPLR